MSYWLGATPPSGGRQCDQTLDGVRVFVSSTDTWRLGRMRGQGPNLYTFDRLCDTSGLVMNSTSSQTVTLPALPRYTNGFLVEAYLEIYTVSATAPATTISYNYTNQDGTAKSASLALGTNWTTPVRRTIPLPLAAGDLGFRNISSIQLDATAATAGNFGIVLARRLALMTTPAGLLTSNEINAFRGGLPQVLPNACLWFLNISSSTSATGTMLELMFIKQ